MPGRFDDCATMETRGKVPTEKCATFDTGRLGVLRSEVVRLAYQEWVFDSSQWMGDWIRRGSSDPDFAPAIGVLRGRVEAVAKRGGFDTRTAAA